MARKDLANSLTFQQRWTLEEDLHFLEAMRLVGYGKWTQISKLMGGCRTPLQVKNRARHLTMYEVDSPLAAELKALANESRPSRRNEKEGPDTYYFTRSFNTRPSESVDSEDIHLSDPDNISVDTEDVVFDDPVNPSDEEAIRSDIIALWDAQKPLQLSLEYIFDTLPERNMEAVTAVYYNLEEENAINTTTPRRRRIRDPNGNWVESSVGEGRTIIHADDSQSIFRRRKSQKQLRVAHEDFELFEPSIYTEPHMAPFTAFLVEWVQKVMIFHCSLSSNEVIGLLGGRRGPTSIEISYVFPCMASESSGVECEMDPVSEMQACEYFEEHRVSLIGWYHSHPSFPANPSKRDIDTQTTYQSVFTDGFIGIIIRPGKNPDFTCFHVASNMAYNIDTQIVEPRNDEPEFSRNIDRIREMYPELDDDQVKSMNSLCVGDIDIDQ
jgi:proteasome lid subunit RPN8/RPN11